MENYNTVFIAGISGNVGMSLARQLLHHGKQVIGLTRNAKKLTEFIGNEQMTIIEGNLDDALSYEAGLKNADAAFALFDFVQGPEKETRQGKLFIDTAKKHGIKYIIYSSVVGADLNTGIPHWESKNQIENYLKQSGIPYTILRPASFFENFLFPEISKRIWKGKFVAPLSKHVVQDMISAEDVGRIASNIILNPDNHINKTLDLAADRQSQEQIAQAFTRVMGKEVKFSKLPGLITRLVMGKKLHTMFNYIDKHGGTFVKDFDVVIKNNPGMLSLEQWVERKFKK